MEAWGVRKVMLGLLDCEFTAEDDSQAHLLSESAN